MDSRDDMIEIFMNETRTSHNTALPFRDGIVTFYFEKTALLFFAIFCTFHLMNVVDLLSLYLLG